jgi:tetratricopeptide (TPR) repeat protein
MKMLRGLVFGVAGLALVACAGPIAPVSKRSAPTAEFPAMKVFPAEAAPLGVARSNGDIFEEFIDYAFALESGQTLARLSRFEGPITVALVNAPGQVVSRDLDRLLSRLRNEGTVPISRVATPKSANIVIEMIPKRQLYRAAPNAACIVVPRMGSWSEFRKNRFNRKSDWTSLDVRTKVAIFMPVDVSAQDARDCLHEELAQALGPLNDLYRVPDSVYNDDNFHITLTSYDMLLLRMFYAPELRSGMAKHEVAAVLPALLRRLNPKGNGLAPRQLQETPDAWASAIEAALGSRGNASARVAAATKAVRVAQRVGITDHRLGFSYYARARVNAARDPRTAAGDYARAYANFVQIFGPYDIHTAQAALQMASLSLSAGDLTQALQYIEPSLVAAKSSQNGRLLFSLLAMKAAIYERGGRVSEAQTLRKEAIGWGQYGVYETEELTARLKIIAGLIPKLPETEG